MVRALVIGSAAALVSVLAGGPFIAGLKRLVSQGRIDPQELVVAFITGAGLKTQEAVASQLPPLLAIEPSITAFEEALSERTGALPATRR